jgi:2-polyprenyl-6-hydroxyphenyl methylase/3-demethylubiquinone-9 3-methyltransferase
MVFAANVDPHEVEKFAELAARWWDTDSEARLLHAINPARLAYVEARCPLAGQRVVDVGCGGGILSEAMAQRGALVTGIDATEPLLTVADLHRTLSGLQIDYRQATAETLAAELPGAFDCLTCMELLEHVPDPASLVAACARLVRPGGHLFFSTLHRTRRAWWLAIVAAEYAFGLLPRGTHRHDKFLRPAELASFCRAAGLDLLDLSGFRYLPILRRVSLTHDVSVNYLAHARRPER